ncbi:hypothetical protein LWI29_002417 [Acer saccharum]|uniref:Reverse transcriptase Ty1/copia-type domain-containing protein n=1 Tax=Acer saccharum TaxID=4024 RepID=A0AA39RPK4_ACESA|nr:hypothetical protein LWI29_002417 [Acer saccharum]
MISLATQNKWKIYHIDVKSAFLNGYLEEEVYLEQPLGFVVKDQEDKVLKLKKALYCLKQAPRAWNSRIDKYFQQNGYVKCPHEHALYSKTNKNGDILLVCLYVDDLIFTGNNQSMFKEFKEAMIREFEMTDIGLMSYYLGIKVKQREKDIFISQERYAKEALEKFNMINSKPVLTPIKTGIKLSKYEEGQVVDPTYFKSLVGSLRYLTCTRPDILFGVGLVSRYMESPTTTHLKTAKKLSVISKGNTTEINVDNKSAIALSKNPVFHDQSKHIDTRFHFIKDCISKKEIHMKYVKSEDQIADIFTKPIKVDVFSKLRTLLGICRKSCLRGDVGS